MTVTVNPVNDMPVTSGDAYTVAEGGTLAVPGPGVLGNDSDIDGDALTAVLFSNPTNGTVNLNPDGGFSYIPDANFAGTDSFIYYANDGRRTATRRSSTSPSPRPPNDDVSGHATTDTRPLPTPYGAATVLTNDIDENPDGPIESLTVSTGMIATTGVRFGHDGRDGSYTYTPATGFTGVDTFEYTVTDGLTSDIGEVSITVSVGVPNIPPDRQRRLPVHRCRHPADHRAGRPVGQRQRSPTGRSHSAHT